MGMTIGASRVRLDPLHDAGLGSLPLLVELDRPPGNTAHRRQAPERETPRDPQEAQPLAVDAGEDPARARVKERRERLLEVLLQRRLVHDGDAVAGVHDPALEVRGTRPLAHEEDDRGKHAAQLEETGRLVGVERIDVLQYLEQQQGRVASGGEVEAGRPHAARPGDVKPGPFEEVAQPLDPLVSRTAHRGHPSRIQVHFYIKRHGQVSRKSGPARQRGTLLVALRSGRS